MISERLKDIRKELKLNQKEFAEKLNISYGTLQTYEQGKVKIPHTFLEILIENFKVNTNWLLTGNGKMFIDENKNKSDSNQFKDKLAQKETFFDYEGKERLFEITSIKGVVGYIIKAKEINGFYEFDAYSEVDPLFALGDLRKKIQKRLSTRYLQEYNGQVNFSHDKAIGHINYDGIVIDGKLIEFDDFIEMLKAYEGFLFELNIQELSNEKI